MNGGSCSEKLIRRMTGFGIFTLLLPLSSMTTAGFSAERSPPQLVTLKEVSCAAGQPVNNFLPSQLTIKFLVPENEDIGTVKISSPTPNQLTWQNLINDTVIQTCEETNKVRQCTGINVAEREDLSENSIHAFEQLPLRADVVASMFDCFGRISGSAASARARISSRTVKGQATETTPPVRLDCAARAAAVLTACRALEIFTVVGSAVGAVIESLTGVNVCEVAADNEFNKCTSGG
jgi:hypothetical protein